jgi:tRNA pseudouridine38-40 synthase
VVRQAEDVPMDFHARYSARRKTYAYIVHNHSIPSALRAPYAWHVPQALALPAMRAAARVLLGRHDFSAFRAASCTARDPWRCLFGLRIVRHAERLVFVLNADGFLQHMARTISAHSWPLAGRSSPLTPWPPFCTLASGKTCRPYSTSARLVPGARRL